MSRSTLYAVLVSLLVVGCSDDDSRDDPMTDSGSEPADSGAPVCEEPPTVEIREVQWQLAIDAPAGGAALAATANAASGLEATRPLTGIRADCAPGVVGEVGELPDDVTPLRLAGGSVDDYAGWRAWADQIRAFDGTCASEDECRRLWTSSGLARNATLSLSTSDGEVLAAWQLTGAWPSSLVEAETADGSIAELGLVATVDEFSFDTSSQTVTELLGAALRPATVPVPPATVDDVPAWVAYCEAVDVFTASYHGPEAVIARLNQARTVQENQTDLAFIRRLAQRAPTFRVEAGGIVLGRFASVSGLDSTTEVVSYREGGLSATTHKLPGRLKWENITLKRGVTNAPSLFERYLGNLDGSPEFEDITICAVAPDSPVQSCSDAGAAASWSFQRGWPCKWSGPSEPIDSTSAEIAIDEVAFVVDRPPDP